ncbi:MAG: hypothetical protein AABY84_07535 [Candidatus Firestonebacteria bacterium]
MNKIICIVIAVFLINSIGCHKKSSMKSDAKKNETMQKEFISAFKKAHETNNIDELMNLIYGENVTDEMRQLSKQYFTENFDRKIETITISSLTGEETLGYTKENVQYRPNLELVANLVVQFSGENNSETRYPLGIKDGKYYLTSFVPASGQNSQVMDAMLNVTSYGYNTTIIINGVKQSSINGSESMRLTNGLQIGTNQIRIEVNDAKDAIKILDISVKTKDSSGAFVNEVYSFKPSSVSSGVYEDTITINK